MTLKLGKASAQAIEDLLNQGFSIAPTQGDYPLMPKDLTELGSEQISNLYSHVIAWTNYVATQLAAAQIDERAAEKLLETQTAKLMLLQPTSTSTVDEKGKVKVTKIPVTSVKANVIGSAEIEKLSEEVDTLYAYRKMIEVMYNNLERDGALISREITRRTGDMKTFRKDKFFA